MRYLPFAWIQNALTYIIRIMSVIGCGAQALRHLEIENAAGTRRQVDIENAARSHVYLEPDDQKKKKKKKRASTYDRRGRIEEIGGSRARHTT